MFVFETNEIMATYPTSNPVGGRVEKVVVFKNYLSVHSITIVRQLERVFEFDQDFLKYKLKDIFIQPIYIQGCHTTTHLLPMLRPFLLCHIFQPCVDTRNAVQ